MLRDDGNKDMTLLANVARGMKPRTSPTPTDFASWAASRKCDVDVGFRVSQSRASVRADPAR